MSNLLQIKTRAECSKEQEQNHPDACSINLSLTPNQLATVDAYKENRYATPENLNMPQSLMQRNNPLHPDAPQNHQYRHPAINRMFLYQSHIWWGPEVKHHDGWDVPEGKFIVQPEVPVDGDVAYQVDIIALSPVESSHIVNRSHYQPSWIDAKKASLIELPHRRIFYP